jgi:5-methylcytosine-specific restriction endonuclease McrA
MVPTESKRCIRCGEAKPLADFRIRNAEKGSRDGVCRECKNAVHRAWSANNADRIRGYGRKRAGTPEVKARLAAATKRCRAKHPERYQQRAARWYAANADRCIQKTKDWQAKNPESRAALKEAYRARCHGSAVGDREPIIAYRKWAKSEPSIPCYWCGITTKRGKRHIDHIIPVARGGADAVANFCVACPSCNQRKHCKLPEHFSGQAELRLA